MNERIANQKSAVASLLPRRQKGDVVVKRYIGEGLV